MSKKSSDPLKWKVDYTTSARKEIEALDGSIKKAIEDKLMTEPLKFGLPLRRSLKNFFKLRVGDFRIIFQVEDQEVTVLVIKVGHRREVYEEKDPEVNLIRQYLPVPQTDLLIFHHTLVKIIATHPRINKNCRGIYTATSGR